MRARTGYPTETQERALLARSAAGFDAHDLAAAGLTQVASEADVVAAQSEVRAIHVSEALQGYVYAVVARTRNSRELSLGASPRAALALMHAAQASAALEGRDFATPDDVKAVAPLVLPHRLIVRPEAEVEGVDASAVVARILNAVEVPKDVAPAPGA